MLTNMKHSIIKVPPDYLAITNQEFIKHFTNLLTRRKFSYWQKLERDTVILGYSCRTLFEICMKYFSRKDIVVATTPFHHTSFRDVIEEYVKPKNIHIIELNDNYNGINQLPDLERCDVVVITHLFGQDMDLSSLADFKAKHNCIVIEDRVQGGSINFKYSHEVVDIALYSMAMDKRPIALGGGFLYINNKQEKIIAGIKEIAESLPIERKSKRFKDLVKKIPTYLLYNNRFFYFVSVRILNLLSLFNRNLTLLNITKNYRKNNPGFSRGYHLYQPSQGLLKSMYENFHNYKVIEELYTKKYAFFMSLFSKKLKSIFFPWYKGDQSLTPYNTILLEENHREQFLEFLNSYNISGLPNPTYKLFNISYQSEKRYTKFSNGIAYLPCLVNISKEEIILLSSVIKEFYKKYYLKK